MMKLLPVFLVWVCFVVGVFGHGRLLAPASRASAWRFGFRNPTNTNDNELNCGGFGNQWQRYKGKCGICGDPWQGPRENEAGGKYANGIITANFTAGQVIDVTIQITANHKGWHEFRLCRNNNYERVISQECLDRHLLRLAGTGETRWYLPNSSTGSFTIRLQLPARLTCSQCVLQWKWNCGNNWGLDDKGRGCVGCGPQEQFYACADVAISSSSTRYSSISTVSSSIPTQTHQTRKLVVILLLLRSTYLLL